MRKSANADISNLFRKFGGDSGNYKEIQQNYIGEQAQQTWPIVKALEKERMDAPRLRKPPAPDASPQAANPAGNAVQSPAPRVQSAAAQPAPTGLSHHAAGAHRPIFQKQEQPAEVPVRSLLGALNGGAQPARPEPAAPVRSLLGAVAQPVVADAPSASIRSLFGSQGTGANQPAQPAPVAPVQSLFGALNKPTQPAPAPAATSTQSLFGALNKPVQSVPAAPAPAATPTQSLFGALNKSTQPVPATAAPAATPAQSLFGALNRPAQSAPAASAPTAAPVRSLFGDLTGGAPTQTQSNGRGAETTQLNDVFSRLSNSQEQEATSAPDNDLRSMLGFLKK